MQSRVEARDVWDKKDAMTLTGTMLLNKQYMRASLTLHALCVNAEAVQLDEDGFWAAPREQGHCRVTAHGLSHARQRQWLTQAHPGRIPNI